MNVARSYPRSSSFAAAAFSLVELMVSMVVFLVIMSVFLLATQGVQRVWSQSDRKVEAVQNGRAVLELFSRELACAVVSDRSQFVQTPNLSTLVAQNGHTAKDDPPIAINSHSLFWVAPSNVSDITKGNLCELGYYLTRDDASSTYSLMRFFVPPGSANYHAADSMVSANVAATTATWLSKTPAAAFDATPNVAASVVSTVAEGVVALWIRCFDVAGNPIPWLCQANGYAAARPLQFNSSAAFQMSSADGPFGAKTFQYLAVPGATLLPANRLPDSVEITVVMVDAKTLKRKPVMPMMAAPSSVDDIPAQMQQFQTDLAAAQISNAQTFSVRLRLAGSSL